MASSSQWTWVWANSWRLVKDREAWWAAVHKVTKHQTKLSDWTTTYHLYLGTILGLGNVVILRGCHNSIYSYIKAACNKPRTQISKKSTNGDSSAWDTCPLFEDFSVLFMFEVLTWRSPVKKILLNHAIPSCPPSTVHLLSSFLFVSFIEIILFVHLFLVFFPL